MLKKKRTTKSQPPICPALKCYSSNEQGLPAQEQSLHNTVRRTTTVGQAEPDQE